MTEPTIDPVTGKPKEKGNGDPPPGDFVQISTEEWAGVKARLDTFEKGFNVQPQPAPTPPAPAGPSFDDQIKTLDSGIVALNTKIDEAVSENKPVSALLDERDKLTQQRTRLQIKHEDIDPVLSQGIDRTDPQTIIGGDHCVERRPSSEQVLDRLLTLASGKVGVSDEPRVEALPVAKHHLAKDIEAQLGIRVHLGSTDIGNRTAGL